MILLLYLFVSALLIALNAFFVLAEFAAVRMRPSRVEELAARGNRQARIFQDVQGRLDEYLSVCQVGITFASIGLGFVGEPAFAQLIMQATGLRTAAAHTLAITVAYIIVSGLHILFGELFPKSVAIRRTERSALSTALPLRFFRYLFYGPLVVLNRATLLLLRLCSLSPRVSEIKHSEDELKILLAQSQDTGLMSFDRLLLLENVFDMGGIRVRDVMRAREGVRTLRCGAPWEETLKVVRDSRFSRFPLVEEGAARPVGIVHVKDLLYEGPERAAVADLRAIARPYLAVSEDALIEKVLGELRRQRGHLAVVYDQQGGWKGIVTLEDVVEEVVGSIEDEFEVEPAVYLADSVTPGRVVLGVRGRDIAEAVRSIFGRLPKDALTVKGDAALRAVIERERAMSTYLGKGLAVPHARLDALERPVVIVGRSETGIPIMGQNEKAHLLFILLTPSGVPRTQVRLLARVCGLFESEYVTEHLREVGTPEEVVDVIRAGEISQTL